jgi:threonyl-tRNA synthetase
MYALRRRSISELPWRAFEFGEVFRNESSGSLSFLLRQRQFVQDDAHIVCRMSQIAELAEGWLSMARQACSWMGCGSPELRLALRPAERLGPDAQWDESESRLASKLDECGMPWSPAPGEGAFYGPKIELGLRDGLGRSWQMGVFQLDMNLPVLFGVSAEGLEPGEELALVHHAVFGSVERAVGVMLACREKDLPAWAHPNAIAVLPVSQKHMEDARAFERSCSKIVGGRAWLCDWDAPLAAKVARAKEAGWLRIAVVGSKESQARRVSGEPCASLGGAVASPMQACRGMLWSDNLSVE